MRADVGADLFHNLGAHCVGDFFAGLERDVCVNGVAFDVVFVADHCRLGHGEMAADGAKVVGTGRNVERGEKTVSLIKEKGGEAIFLPTDVTKEAAWQEVMDRTLQTYGRLDSVINNAGDSILKPLEDLTLDDLQFLLQLNLEGSFLGTKAAMQTMGPEGGCVINVTVLSALGGNLHSTAYSAAKGALSHFTRAAALAGAPCRRLGTAARSCTRYCRARRAARQRLP